MDKNKFISLGEILIAHEAGALVTDINGGDQFFRKLYPVLAASPAIHAEMLQVIRDT